MTTSKLASQLAALAILALVAAGAVRAAEAGDARPFRPSSWNNPITNEFGSVNSKCRGACGGDCPPTCEYKEEHICYSPSVIKIIKLYQCGTHEGCRIHDDCLDECFEGFDAAAWDWAEQKAAFFAGACQRKCHAEAYAFAEEELNQTADGRRRQQSGVYTAWDLVWDWADGHGLFSGEMTFAYTRDEPNGPEFTRLCPNCTVCQDGKCGPDPSNPDCSPVNIFGDPHIVTPDGLAFDFHATGDYTLATTADGRFHLAGRFEEAAANLSLATGVALRVDGHQIEAYFGPQLEVLLDGVVQTDGETLLASGARLVLNDGRATIVADAVGQTIVERTRRALHVGFQPASGAPTMRGILGDIDGDPANDLPTAGEPLAWPLALDDFYREFAGAWRISADESPFSRAFAAVPATPTRVASVADNDPAAIRLAESACSQLALPAYLVRACLVDVAATGDTGYAEDAVRGQHPAVEVTFTDDAASNAGATAGDAAPVEVNFPSFDFSGHATLLLEGAGATDADRPVFRLKDDAAGDYFIAAFYRGGESTFSVRAPDLRAADEREFSLSLPGHMTGEWSVCAAPMDGRTRPRVESEFEDCLDFMRLAPATAAARPAFTVSPVEGGAYVVAWRDMPPVNAELLLRDAHGAIAARAMTSSRAEGVVSTRLHAPFTLVLELRYTGPLVVATATLAAP